MDAYDYKKAIREDVDDYLNDIVNGYINDDYRNKLYDDMFISDAVTGNGSGSYTFNTWKAEENLCHNLELISEASEAFGEKCVDLSKGAEHWDVTIRCYLLDSILNEAVEDWNEKHPEEDKDDENEEA